MYEELTETSSHPAGSPGSASLAGPIRTPSIACQIDSTATPITKSDLAALSGPPGGGTITLVPDWLTNWRNRYIHPASRVLHAIAIPMLPLAGVLGTIQLANSAWDRCWIPVGLPTASYFLQWIGHRIEGNDMGEVILIKKLLGRPYVAVAARYEKPTSPADAGATT